MASTSGKPGPGDSDEALFAQAMRDVRRLDGKGGPSVVAEPPRAGPAPSRRRDAEREGPSLERWGEQYALLARGADRRLVRALRAGQARPEARLDLHGSDGVTARASLRAFVERAAAEGRRCLLVIHGRGHHSGPAGPVLCDAILEELARPPLSKRVLAVASAPPALGGPGAALMLLRRPR